MRRIPGVRRLPQVGSGHESIEKDIDAEMHFHIQMRVEDLMREGRSADDAKDIAAREYGDVMQARRELRSIDRRTARQASWREWLASWTQDIRFALRGFRARPGFALTVLITVALGVGANAAIFSVVDAVLLRPLPFAQPDRLVHLWETFQSKVDQRSEASYPDYLDWRSRNHSFADLGGYNGAAFLVGGQQPMLVAGARATANFFNVLGVHAVVGRTFVAGEDAAGAPKVTLLTYGFWMRQFGGDRAAVGRTISLNGSPATIVGVLPKDFQFARQGAAELWTPIDQSARTRASRGNHWLNIVGRLSPGVTQTQAARDMSRIMADLAREYPESNAGRDGQVVPLQKELVGSIEPIILLLYGAVVVVFLIACVNVANLLLIRGADRQREIAVRAALGAGIGRLVRQLLTESLVLALAGGLLGLGVAQLGLRWLIAAIPNAMAKQMSMIAHVTLDARIVAYGLIISVGAGLLFGVVPALRATRSSAQDVLRGGGRGATSAASRLRDGLVVGEVALTVVLLSGAMLFGRSVLRLLAINPGFRAEQLLTSIVEFPATEYSSSRSQAAVFDRLTEQLRATPGIESVGLVSRLPLDFGNSLGFDIIGQPLPAPGKEPTASYRQTDAGYFTAAGIPVLRGRGFTNGDVAGAPSVVVVNQTLAKAYFGDVDPVGQRIYGFGDTAMVVGVVGDVPIGGIDQTIPPTLYMSFAQDPEENMAVVVRTSLPPESSARAMRGVLTTIDRSAAITNVAMMTDVIGNSPSVFLRRFPLYLVGAFALTALALAIVGIYGVVSYSVAQRTREMGIRMALGAPASSLVRLVVRHGGWMVIAGIAIGTVGALVAGRAASSMLYGVAPSDPLTYVAVTAVLAVVAVAATMVPARRATKVDPSVALRSE
ncbi:MAG TPA: ABC transporter permease [Gemmatimonadaceae bacterium]|jgi:predicted permease